MSLTLDAVKKAVVSKGYKWFEDKSNKGYDVNIVGIRNSETSNEVTNHFDDTLTISYKVDGEWKFHSRWHRNSCSRTVQGLSHDWITPRKI